MSEQKKPDETAKKPDVKPAKPKIGAGHTGAMLRLGLKELRNAMNPSKESVADTEFGLYGTMTQGEVAQARGSYGLDPNQERSVKEIKVEAPSLEPTKTAEATSPEVAAEMARMRGNEQSRSRGM